MNTNMTNDIVRVVIFVLSWVNSYLVAHGHKPIPVIDQTQVAWILTFGVSIWAMLKESPFKSMASKATKAEADVKTVASEAATTVSTVASEAQVIVKATQPETPTTTVQAVTEAAKATQSAPATTTAPAQDQTKTN